MPPGAKLRASPEYFSEPEDLHALARSVRRMRDMMGASAICQPEKSVRRSKPINRRIGPAAA